MLGMLLELEDLDGEGIEGMLELDELWLVDSQASNMPLRLTSSRPLPITGQTAPLRWLAPACGLVNSRMAVFIFSLSSWPR